MNNYVGIPDFVERKGSLYLRSDHMNYSRPTLNSNWHQAREAEPKEYDINGERIDQRNLHRATYNRIGNVTDGSFPLTTTKASLDQVYLKKDFEEQETRKALVNLDTSSLADLDRDTGHPKRGFGAVLPRHHPEHDKQHMETTNRADYKPPFPYTPVPEQPPDFVDNSNAVRKCHSQFTDASDYRRFGRNTWQDESGIYANTQLKRETFPPTNTIPQVLE
ncbi:cilia- and flagella-associated protein 95-like [Amphiura filiformis]|uniref:cilia- and flagella-associated protein 95-like n=1 Tax=Amphiura filiformis TaxID=82378 RepID=UPI003B21693B